MILNQSVYIIDRANNKITGTDAGTDCQEIVDDLTLKIEENNSSAEFIEICTGSNVIAWISETAKAACNNKKDKDAIICENHRCVANEFLAKETSMQSYIDRLGNLQISTGCLFQALMKDEEKDSEYTYLIAKLDTLEYLNQRTMNKDQGVQISGKRLGKSCLISLSISGGACRVVKVRILSDTGAIYFSRDFLKVEPVYKDDECTEKAVKSITASIYRSLQQEYPRQRLELKNSFVAYMRSNDFIDYDIMVGEVFEKYLANANNIDDYSKDKLLKSLERLPDSKKFSKQFNRVSEKIKLRIIQDMYKLTPDIDLIIKNETSISPINTIVSGAENDGRSFLKIYTTDQDAINTFKI